MFQDWNGLKMCCYPCCCLQGHPLLAVISVPFQLALADRCSPGAESGISRQQWVISTLLGSPAHSGSCDTSAIPHCVLVAACHRHLSGETGVSWRRKLGLCCFTWDPAMGQAQREQFL